MPIVLSNQALREQAIFQHGVLNEFSELRLFANDIVPNSATPFFNFIEPVGSGYYVASLTGTWSEPQKALDGLWYTEAAEVTYPAPVSGQYTAYGYYVMARPGLRLSDRFPAPVVMTPDGGPYKVRVRLYQASIPVICSDPHFAGP